MHCYTGRGGAGSIRSMIWGLLLLISNDPAGACSSFVLEHGGQLVMAKNLDWPVGDGLLLVNPAGRQETAHLGAVGDTLRWTARFGSVSFNMFGRGFPLGGMNEAGLVIEEMSYSPSRYPDDTSHRINEFQWIQYHLDLSSSVPEVLASLDTLGLCSFFVKLHYLICDAAGRSAVVEFINGKLMVYTGDDLVVPALTNNSYANAIKYLHFHQNFGGERIVGDGPESPERFVRVASGLLHLKGRSRIDAVAESFHLLENVAQDDTQWSIVYEPRRRMITFRTMNNSQQRAIDLMAIDFHDSARLSRIDAPGSKLKWLPYTVSENRSLLDRVMQRLMDIGELDMNDAATLKAAFLNI